LVALAVGLHSKSQSLNESPFVFVAFTASRRKTQTAAVGCTLVEVDWVIQYELVCLINNEDVYGVRGEFELIQSVTELNLPSKMPEIFG